MICRHTYCPILMAIKKPVPERQNTFDSVRVIGHPRSHYTVSIVKLEVLILRRISEVACYCVHVD